MILCVAALTIGAAAFTGGAQDKPAHPFYIALQSGGLVSVNENVFSYHDNGRTADLVTQEFGLAIGYDFSNYFGARLSGAFGKNVSACNVNQTSAGGFYPYDFKSVNVFADAILNLKPSGVFSPKLYVGAGGAYTFGFSDPGHPWQEVRSGNAAFGFRGGFIAQWDCGEHVGIFADLCGEAYTDQYNGLRPNSEDQSKADGYAGFPLDLRGVVSLGVLFRF